MRPVTCAGIAVSALIFFSLLYFGKTWTEARVKLNFLYQIISRKNGEGEGTGLIVKKWLATYFYISIVEVEIFVPENGKRLLSEI